MAAIKAFRFALRRGIARTPQIVTFGVPYVR